jgi:hypothetical protein
MTDIPAATQQPATPTAPTRRRGLLLWLPLVLGILLGFGFLEWARTHVLILLDRAAFGRETAVYTGGKLDRAQCSGSDDSQQCVDSWVHAGKPPVVLWFGNSQLMGINRAKPADVNAPGQLRALLASR